MSTIRNPLIAIVLVVLPCVAAAQGTATAKGDPKPRKPPAASVSRADVAAVFSQQLFPPELIMQHQVQLKITESQRNAMLHEIRKLQSTAPPLQWRIAEEAEKLNDLLTRDGVRESDLLLQADRMMKEEMALKRVQLEMLVRIRNLLTTQQKETLRVLRGRE